MPSRILLGFLLTSSVGYGAVSDTSTLLCQKAIQPLSRLDETIDNRIADLQGTLKGIKSITDLRTYLGDPEDGGGDGRRDFFYIGIYGQVLRRYKDQKLGEDFEKIIDETFNVVEDKVGKYSEYTELRRAAKAYLMATEFVNYLDGKADKALVDLYLLLQESEWIGVNNDEHSNPKLDFEALKSLDDVRKDIADLNWEDSVEKDHKRFFQAMREMAKDKYQKMVVELKPTIETPVWNYWVHMEEGLHEIRRLLRQILLIIQSRPEAFSFSKPITSIEETLGGLAHDPVAYKIAKKALEDAITGNSGILNLGVRVPGTLIINPESYFYNSGLVSGLGKLKGKAELYSKMQKEIGLYLSTHENLGRLTSKSTELEIQQYVIDSSALAEKKALQLQDVFVAGDKNTFQFIRKETLEKLDPFWRLNPLKELENGAQMAKKYWDERD
jgi:hypothetical protein